ncbi:ABC transporter substrate-binding protein [Streptomyces sp. NPDC056405]|uniref:ABC transporter substrate-binding protein n=1 Tax=Streptomyces sp. NPDC056405 TaxID=3345811 RepID=UPI0035E172A3
MLTSVLVLAGCSANTSEPGGGGQDSAAGTEINVGVGTGVFTAPLTTDAFAEEGLKVTRKAVNSGAAAVPLLLNGQLQFSVSDATGALTAISKGIPLVIVATATVSGQTALDDPTAVLVKKNATIRSASDLEGKKVAVNGLGNISQLSAAAAIDRLGGDSSKVDFVEMPPHTMTGAVTNGAVDAAVTSEPGVVLAHSAGLRTLFSPMSEALPGVPIFVYVTSKAYLAKHRDVVDKFARANVAANKYTILRPDFVRSYAKKSSNLSDAQASDMVLPEFAVDGTDKLALQRILDTMVKYKTINSPIDMDEAVLTP